MKLGLRVLCYAVLAALLRAGQASTVGTEYYAGEGATRSTNLKLVGLESKVAIENDVLRKENMQLKQFLMQSSVQEKDTSNNIDLVSYIQEKEQAPKLLCETFANSAVSLCKKQYVDCIKKAAESTSKKMTARSIRRMQQDPRTTDEQDRMEQAQENAGNLFQTRLQRREKSAALMKQPKPFMTLPANARIPPPSSLPPLSNKGDPEKAIVDATKKLVNDGSITSSDKKQIDAEQKLWRILVIEKQYRNMIFLCCQ